MPPLVKFSLVYGLVVRVYHAVVAGLIAALGAVLGSGLLVQLLGNRVEGLLDFLGSGLDGLYVVALVDFLQLVKSCLDGSLLGVW